MTTPDPLGPLYYDLPHSQKIRDPQDLNIIHSVVHSGVSIQVENVTEAQAIRDSWQVIMQAAADEAQAILSALRVTAQ